MFGLVCSAGSAACGHGLIPNAASDQFTCIHPECNACLSTPEANKLVSIMQCELTALQKFCRQGLSRAGCLACFEAEKRASLILMPENELWFTWVTAAMAIAGLARNTQLLLAVIRRREAMCAKTSSVDIFLMVSHAIAIGLGSEMATSLLRNAFKAASDACDGDPRIFVRKNIPIKPPFGARARAAASVALGLDTSLPLSPERAPTQEEVRWKYSLRGGEMFPSAQMQSLARARTPDEVVAMQELAAERIGTWASARESAAQKHEAQNLQLAATPAATPIPAFDDLHEYRREHWSAGPEDATDCHVDRLWKIDDVFTPTECEEILSAVKGVTAARGLVGGGWDKDRHGAYPTTDLPLSAVPAAEVLIRTTIFKRVLRPLAPHFLPSPALPEHLELIDCFFVKYSAAKGGQKELQSHSDGSTFSFNILLNEPSDFEGGGTRFEKSGKVVHVKRGAALGHSGHVEHSGVAISAGERYLLVGFVGCVVYPYTHELLAEAENDAYGKFGGAAWDRSKVPFAVSC